MRDAQIKRLADFDKLQLWQPAIIALSVSILKISLFDWGIFTLRIFPPHDSVTALLQFQTSVHAFITENDLAWWTPTPAGGYAQYYNSFLSPLMPTSGSPLFLIWLLGIKALSFLSIRIPEYIQFIIFEFGISPFLAFLAFALLVRRFVVSWLVVAIATTSYALGGTEIWNNAWMFHQEWATLFLLFVAFDRFILIPTIKRFAFLIATIFITVISASYWTIFSSWFVTAFLAIYTFIFWSRVKRSIGSIAGSDFWPSAKIKFSVITLVVVPLACWTCLLWLILSEQRNLLAGRGSPFSLQAVYERANEVDVTRFTTEFFNPILERAIEHYSAINNDHSAVYIGASLIPLLLIFAFSTWNRRSWLIAGMCIVMASVRMTSGIFMMIYEAFSLLKSQRHIFYFYQYFLQICLILAASVGASSLASPTKYKKDVQGALIISGTSALILFAILFLTSGYFSVKDPTLKSIGFIAIILAISSVLIFQMRPLESRLAVLPLALLLFLHIGDMARYYRIAEQKDQAFSMTRWPRKTIDGRIENYTRVKSAWPRNGFKSDFDFFQASVIPSDLWPKNSFNPSQEESVREGLSADIKDLIKPDKMMSFFSSDTTANEADRQIGNVDVRLTKWGYNRMEFETNTQADSLAVTFRNFDPYWIAKIDGVEVKPIKFNKVFLGVHLSSGSHSVVFEYRPLARIVFWPCVLLMAFSLVMVLMILREIDRNSRQKRPCFLRSD